MIDADLQKPARSIFGSGDSDVDLGSTGTLHATTLIFLINPAFTSAQLGVSAITCPNGTSPSFSTGDCVKKVIDTAGADRQWITSEGSRVYISYHDAGNSSLVHVQRSDDDGYTWRRAGDPIVGQDGATADATFNNTKGPIVADPFTHNVYDIYAAGEPGLQKGTTATFNNIIVSRSTDGGRKWKANLVFHAPVFTALNNIFPALAVDPTNGKLYAAWSDAHQILFSASSDQGSHWSPAVAVNIAPASTALFPWVAAYNGTVDVVYYATTAASKDDPAAVWNVYMAQTTNDGASFAQSLVSNTPNHVGVVCTNGIACAAVNPESARPVRSRHRPPEPSRGHRLHRRHPHHDRFRCPAAADRAGAAESLTRRHRPSLWPAAPGRPEILLPDLRKTRFAPRCSEPATFAAQLDPATNQAPLRINRGLSRAPQRNPPALHGIEL